MARFDVYPNRAGNGYLLDVQSNLLSGLNTRVVIPLLTADVAPQPADRLNPVFEVEGTQVVMATQFMAAIPEPELTAPAGNLASRQAEISAALDLLFLGF